MWWEGALPCVGTGLGFLGHSSLVCQATLEE